MLSLRELRIICRLALVEYQYVLVDSQGASVRVEETRGAVYLVPYQVVPPQLRIRHHQPCGEHSLGEKHDCPVVLDNPLVLCPEFVHRQHPVPVGVLVALVQDFVWQIANDSTNGLVRNLLHLH